MTVKILKGLPASGKSTYAMELVEQGWLRTNRDSLRIMLSGGEFSPENEKVIRAMRNAAIIWGVHVGKNVVVDDTNLNPRDEADIRMVVGTLTDVVVRVFPMSPNECCLRDEKRTGLAHVGHEVIHRMAELYNWPPVVLPEGVEVHEYAQR